MTSAEIIGSGASLYPPDQLVNCGVREKAQEPAPFVRSASHTDVPDLARIELASFSDVYGNEPLPELRQTIEKKYNDRVSLLGDWVRILEDPDKGVIGMMVCCPTSRTREDFMTGNTDFTENDTIRDMYDPDGKNMYVVNLAIDPENQGKRAHIALFADGVKKGLSAGIKHAYFESRLPGFKRWAESELASNIVAEGSGTDPRQIADTYWRTTAERNGKAEPIDPLLRLYTRIGAKPLRLVENAWKPDEASGGYGVLCEISDPRPSWLKTVEWFRRHKRSILLGASAIAAAGYALSEGGMQDVIESAKENAWALPTYFAGLALHIGGLCVMGAGLGLKWKELTRLFKVQEVGEVTAKGEFGSRLAKCGYYINLVGALAAAGVAGVAVIKTLPVGAALLPLSLVAADVYSTVVSRYLVHKKIIRKL